MGGLISSVESEYLVDRIMEQLTEYYNEIVNTSLEFNINQGMVQYLYTDMEETITQGDKTRQLRDIIIPSILGDGSDDNGSDELIRDIDRKKVVDDDDDDFALVSLSVVVKQKSIPSESLSIEFGDSVSPSDLIALIIYKIDDKIREIIKGIKEVKVDSVGELQYEMYNMMSVRRMSMTLYGMDKFLNEIIQCDTKILNSLKPHEILLVPNNMPLLMCIRDISVIRDSTDYSKCKLFITMNLDLISELEDCLLIKLTDRFKSS